MVHNQRKYLQGQGVCWLKENCQNRSSLLSWLQFSDSLLLGTVELFAAQRLLDFVIAFSVAQFGGDLSRMSTRVIAMAKFCLTLGSSLATVTREHVLVMLTEGVVVQDFGVLSADGHGQLKRVRREFSWTR